MKFACVYRPFWEDEEGFNPNVSDSETDYDPILFISDSLEKAKERALDLKNRKGGFVYDVDIVYDPLYKEVYAYVELNDNKEPFLAHFEDAFQGDDDLDWMCRVYRI